MASEQGGGVSELVGDTGSHGKVLSMVPSGDVFHAYGEAPARKPCPKPAEGPPGPVLVFGLYYRCWLGMFL